jgi:hypothetical protein
MIHLGGKYCTIFTFVFGITMKLIMLIKMCLIESYIEISIGKIQSSVWMWNLVSNIKGGI